MKNEKMQLKEQKKQLMDEYQFYKNADGECEGTIEGILTALGKTVIDLKELEESGPHTWCPQCGKSMDDVVIVPLQYYRGDLENDICTVVNLKSVTNSGSILNPLLYDLSSNLEREILKKYKGDSERTIKCLELIALNHLVSHLVMHEIDYHMDADSFEKAMTAFMENEDQISDSEECE